MRCALTVGSGAITVLAYVEEHDNHEGRRYAASQAGGTTTTTRVVATRFSLARGLHRNYYAEIHLFTIYQ